MNTEDYKGNDDLQLYDSVITSSILQRVPERAQKHKELQHIYLGIDNGNEYVEQDIICESFAMEMEPKEYILHNDFDWLYEE